MLTDGALANSFPLICHCQALFMPSSIGRLFYPLNLCDDKYFVVNTPADVQACFLLRMTGWSDIQILSFATD